MKLKATNKSKLSDGKTMGGIGRVTEGKIKQLQKYYGLAIRQNTSTKPNPTQAEIDVAAYNMNKNIIALLHHSVQVKDPGKQHRNCGITQNPNECLNYLVWARCPKHKHHAIKVVRCTVASAVCHFHSGAASRVSLMRCFQHQLVTIQ